MYTHIKDNALVAIEQALKKMELADLEELYQFGEKTGKLAGITIIKMCHGAPLNSFFIQEIYALFEFLNCKFNIGDPSNFFYKDRPIVNDNESAQKERIHIFLLSFEDAEYKRVAASRLKKISQSAAHLFKKEIKDLSLEEAIEALDNIGYTNFNVATQAMRSLKQYADWCAQKGYYVPHKMQLKSLKESHVKIESGVKSSLISNPAELKKIIDIAKEEGLITDCIVVCLYWLGFTFDDIYNLLDSDVDLHRELIRNTHFGEVKIPSEFLGLFIYYTENDIIYTERAEMLAVKSGYFIKKFAYRKETYNNNRISPSRIRRILVEFKEKYESKSGKNMQITSKNLGVSGACWRLYSRELRGEILDDKVYQYEGRFISNTVLQSFKQTYQEYKRIFYSDRSTNT